MPDAGEAVLPLAGFDERPPASGTSAGLLPYQVIKELIRSREIEGTRTIAGATMDEGQIQPASLDLRLGSTAYRVRASFLPGPDAVVAQKIDQFCMHEIDLSAGAVLERNCVYIVPLIERLHLSSRISGVANPKSSTGRLDIFTRLITDRATEFERIEAGYDGPLYVEISPRAFSVVVRTGSRLNQLRLRRGTPPALTDSQLLRLHEQEQLVDRPLSRDDRLSEGIPVRVNLTAQAGGGPIGYKARKHTGLIDVDQVGRYDPAEFWEPVAPTKDGGVVLEPDVFYVLASKEAVRVPPTHAAEMRAYDTFVGEFRVHYAGFFDPGFGYGSGSAGTRAVLEVRSHEVPFRLDDGQVVGRLVYEKLTDKPDKIYGTDVGSSYQRQGLQLAKQFRMG